MFSQLTKYVFEQWLQPEVSSETTSTAAAAAAEGVEHATSSRLTSAETEDEWVLVDRRLDIDDDDDDDDVDSEGNSKCSSMESLNVNDADDDDDGVLVVEESPDRVLVVNTLPVPALLTRTNSTSSLPRVATVMEESWFLTPPPCFISTGPVHMETSPLENLLIEHPSMSVYTHHGRRHNFAAAPPTPEPETAAEVEVEEDEHDDEVVLVRRPPRIDRVQVLQQLEIQGLKSRQAQKVQIKKACKFFKRGYLDRNNKAREVNSRNRRQRRGERSQGAKRSFANNNRKC